MSLRPDDAARDILLVIIVMVVIIVCMTFVFYLVIGEWPGGGDLGGIGNLTTSNLIDNSSPSANWTPVDLVALFVVAVGVGVFITVLRLYRRRLQ